MPAPPAIEVLYLDEHIVAVAKPSGLLVHRGWANDRVAALQLVRDTVGQRVNPLHRLDRGTSGVLLFALTLDATRLLSRAFEEGKIEKSYLALVRGHAPPEGEIDHPLPARENGPRVDAFTSFRCIAHSSVDRCSLVEARPRTGRLHQVRRHLRHINHPLVGDVRHGDGKVNRHYRATYGLHRLALHAWTVRFEHPHTGETLNLAARVPEDLAEPLRQLELPLSQNLGCGIPGEPSRPPHDDPREK